jgi:hypothetical protein
MGARAPNKKEEEAQRVRMEDERTNESVRRSPQAHGDAKWITSALAPQQTPTHGRGTSSISRQQQKHAIAATD